MGAAIRSPQSAETARRLFAAQASRGRIQSGQQIAFVETNGVEASYRRVPAVSDETS
jgi:hypothetical protein